MAEPPAGSTLHMDVIDAEEAARRDKEEFDRYAAGLAEGEVLKRYAYGGPLSGRGGFFVVRADEPGRVLRFNQTWMS